MKRPRVPEPCQVLTKLCTIRPADDERRVALKTRYMERRFRKPNRDSCEFLRCISRESSVRHCRAIKEVHYNFDNRELTTLAQLCFQLSGHQSRFLRFLVTCNLRGKRAFRTIHFETFFPRCNNKALFPWHSKGVD